MVNKINFKMVLSLLTVMAIFMQIFATPFLAVKAWAAESVNSAAYEVGKSDTGKLITSSVNPRAQLLRSTGNSTGKMSAWYGGYETSTAFITVDGLPAFCIDPNLPFPLNEEYAESIYHDEGVYNILYYGYPHNGTSEKDYVDTYVALNVYLGAFDSASMKNDSGVKYLLDAAKNKTAPAGTFDITNKVQTAKWNPTTQRSETGWYPTVTTGNNNKYTIPALPAGVKAVTADGKEYSGPVKIDVKTYFKLVADPSYSGTVNLTIPTDVREPSSLKFTPKNGNVQSLLSAGGFSDPITVTGIKATFEAQLGNLEIIKKGNDTTSLLPGAKYEVRNSAGTVVATPTTGANGKVTVSDLLQGTYTVKEITAPNGYLVATASQNITVKAAETSQVTFTNTAVLGQVTLSKEDSETGEKAQGDAVLDGAEFDILNASGAIVDHVVIKNGKATSKKLPLGNYTAKETKSGVGYNLQTKTFPFSLTYKDQNTALVLTDKVATNDVIKGKIEINKYSHSNEGGSGFLGGLAGAEFTVIHKATGKEVAKITTDANGHAITPDLPYGQYIVKESKTPAGFIKIGDFDVEIKENNKTLTYNVVDGDLKGLVKIIKKDKETGKTIPLAGTTFKVKDLSTGEFISQKVNYPKPATITEFETNDEGYLVLPTELKAGNYELYEVSAPNGYVLDKTPLKFAVTDSTVKDGVITVDFFNAAQKSIVTLSKTGEVLTNASKKDSKYGEVVTGEYTQKPLAGATFNFVAKEDIITKDGTVRYAKGTVVATGTSDENGQIKTEAGFYAGQYEAVETAAPAGYVIGEPVAFEVKYAGQDVAITSTSVTAENALQDVAVKVFKEEQTIAGWMNGKPIYGQQAANNKVFGVYANQDYTYNNQVIIAKGDLMGYATVKDGVATIQQKLANGNYTLKELDAGTAHNIDTKAYDFTLEAKDNAKTFEISILKDKVLYGEEAAKAVNEVSLLNELAKQDVELVKVDVETEAHETALAGISFDLEQLKDGLYTKVASYKTDKDGKIALSAIPTGDYRFVETKTLTGYVLDQTPVNFKVDATTNGEKISLKMVNKRVPIEIGTKATGINGEKVLNPFANTVLVDKIDYKWLIPGKEYTMVTKAVNPANIQEVYASSTTKFTPTQSHGSYEVKLPVDGSKLAGKNVVFLEYLNYNGKEVAKHENPKDKDQTVRFAKPEMSTQATFENGQKAMDPTGPVKVKDTMKYTGMVPGKAVKVITKAVNVKTGEVIQSKTTAFTPQTANGNYVVEMMLDGKKLAGQDIVFYEYFYTPDTNQLIAKHEDRNDKGQTVHFNELKPVKSGFLPTTGDTSTDILILAGVLTLLAGSTWLISIRRKKVNE
ncbi:SpaA isopeptide-forming pilin-related protein [Listeria booriae]|uniref:SpaA isopeptide-forming pilin-related protein n=1 Tax=Listeria booriae TaxID=1552123 RepID=UPI00162A8144|nr:SpaA isopeptide-forming pilin-related protein [Listeria booriae]MBC2149644.1 VaFE repeat-containing surface-anchored protein [Listeria booriae]